MNPANLLMVTGLAVASTVTTPVAASVLVVAVTVVGMADPTCAVMPPGKVTDHELAAPRGAGGTAVGTAEDGDAVAMLSRAPIATSAPRGASSNGGPPW